MRIRSLILIFAMSLGLAACFEGKDCPAPPDQPGKVTELKSEVEKLKGDVTRRDENVTRLERNLASAYDRQKELGDDAMKVIGLIMNPKGLVEKVMKEADRAVVDYKEGGGNIVRFFHQVSYDALGTYSREATVAALDNLVANPEMAQFAYTAAKPAILPVARLMNIRFDSVAILVTKSYDPFIGALAATEGHGCRWEFGAPSDQKTEKCKRIFKRISDYYGVDVTMDMVETLGVMHRRYLSDTSPTHDGFDRLRFLAKDLLGELKKS